MAPDDLTPREDPRPYFGSNFSRAITLLLGVLLALMFAFVSVQPTAAQRVRMLEHPVRSTVRQFERDVEIQDALMTAPDWARRIVEIPFGTSSDARVAAIGAYRDVLEAQSPERDDDGVVPKPKADEGQVSRGERAPSASTEQQSPSALSSFSSAQRELAAEKTELRARLAILLEECGRWDEARSVLAELDESGHAALAGAVRSAYGGRASDVPRIALDPGELGPGWAKDRLEIKLAERDGDTVLADRVRAEAARRGDRWRTRILLLALSFVGPCVIGLVILLAWLWKDRPRVLEASALIPPAWGWDDGCAVLVRSAFAGLAIATVVVGASGGFGVHPFALWSGLIASVPMLWWIRRALLAPHGLDFRRAFGLGAGDSDSRRLDPARLELPRADRTAPPSLGRKLLSWTAFAFALIAIDQLGVALLSLCCTRFGLEPHWTEMMQESEMWGPTHQALLGAVDGVAWAPIFEEIGCRGLLYLTLRTRSGPQVAALFSASIFGMVHFYSLPGFLSVAWSGYVYAVGFERCRSLVRE